MPNFKENGAENTSRDSQFSLNYIYIFSDIQE